MERMHSEDKNEISSIIFSGDCPISRIKNTITER